LCSAIPFSNQLNPTGFYRMNAKDKPINFLPVILGLHVGVSLDYVEDAERAAWK